MTTPGIDTDIIIRLLTGDDPVKQVAARRLFDQIERGTLSVGAPDTVIADAVYVLASPRLYHLPHTEVAGLLATLVRLPGFKIRNRRIVLQALAIFGARNIDFGDAMIVAALEARGAEELYSYDGDFDGFAGIRRIEP